MESQAPELGNSVAIDGNIVIVGAEGANAGCVNDCGAAYLFDASTGQELHKLISPSQILLKDLASQRQLAAE